MNSLEKLLINTWRDIEPEYRCERYYRKIFSHCGLDWYAGYLSPDVKAVWMFADIRPKPVPQSQAVNIRQSRSGKRHCLTASLVDGDDQVFAALWSDLIIHSCKGSTQDEILNIFAGRYKTWVKLLMRKKDGRLSKGEQKGLFGELCFLKSELDGGRHAINALRGWMGPEGADQDFTYADGWYEIKSTFLGSDQISISSLQQLSAAPDGHLIVYFIDQVSPERPDACTLPEIVENIKRKLENSDDALDIFEEKLISAGYVDLDEYQQIKFFNAGGFDFRVDSDFPKLTTDNVSPGIINAQYQLALSALDKWKVRALNG